MKGREAKLSQSDECLRLLVESVEDYAILLLDSRGYVVSWNAGAARILGYRAEEIIGRHLLRFYDPEASASGKPERALKVAAAQGRFESEGWGVRKDGTRFRANVILTALKGEAGHLRGFAEVSRDLTKRRRAEEEVRVSVGRAHELGGYLDRGKIPSGDSLAPGGRGNAPNERSDVGSFTPGGEGALHVGLHRCHYGPTRGAGPRRGFPSKALHTRRLGAQSPRSAGHATN